MGEETLRDSSEPNTLSLRLHNTAQAQEGGSHMITRNGQVNRIGKAFALLIAFVCCSTAAQADYILLLETNNSNPNGNGVYQNGGAATGGGSMLPMYLTNTTGQTLQLSHLEMGVSAYQQFGLRTADMYAQGWTPPAYWAGDPLDPGDLVGRASVPAPTITGVGTGNIFGVPIDNYIASWAEGSLLSLNFILAPGESAYFTIAVDGQSNNNGHWFTRESVVPDPSDTLWLGPGLGYMPFENISWTQYDGRLEANAYFTAIPEPGALSLTALGAMAFFRRRRRS